MPEVRDFRIFNAHLTPDNTAYQGFDLHGDPGDTLNIEVVGTRWSGPDSYARPEEYDPAWAPPYLYDQVPSASLDVASGHFIIGNLDFGGDAAITATAAHIDRFDFSRSEIAGLSVNGSSDRAMHVVGSSADDWFSGGAGTGSVYDGHGGNDWFAVTAGGSYKGGAGEDRLDVDFGRFDGGQATILDFSPLEDKIGLACQEQIDTFAFNQTDEGTVVSWNYDVPATGGQQASGSVLLAGVATDDLAASSDWFYFS